MDETWGNLLDRSLAMWNHYKVEQTKHVKQAGTWVGVWSHWKHHPESRGQLGEHTATKSNLSRHLLNLKVLPTSKALKLYTTMSSSLTTNCFALLFKWKLNKCMMNCDDQLRCFSEILTNWHWISIVRNSCIRGKWLCMTCSNNKVQTLFFVKKIVHLTGMHT